MLTIRESFPAPGTGPAGLAWDGVTLWHADYRAGRIYGLDPASGAARRSLHCPGNLSGLAWDGRALWQSLFDQEMIRCVNPETHDFDRTILLTGQGWLSGVACDGRTLWTVAQQRGQLLPIALETGQVGLPVAAPVAVGDIDFRDGCLWASVAGPMRFDPLLRRFEWETDEPRYAILRLDPADGRELARYPADALYTGLCWAGDSLWLAHAAAGRLLRAELIR
jgi:sugar lactone lactonase YvrE